MAGQGQSGRSIVLTRGGVPVAGVRTKSISIAGSPIDVTSDDNAAVRKLLDMPGQIDVSISVSGVLLNDQLQSEAVNASDRVQATQFIIGGYGGSPANTHGYSGEFFLSSFNITGEYQGMATFEATFESAGAVAYAAP